ncbi:MAG: tRNA-guanine(34) transglycosylase, partial [Verrucomicrobia bacterium]|nr:tRNA-guanine(34) transglycosylase [Verrucomicrobiota bacterium]
GPDAVLARGQWESRQFPGLSWELHVGDFWEKAAQASAKPDIIYYDFFSQKTNGDCWALESFQKLFAHCDPKKSAQLFTYCSSTTARVAMLNAGFYVAVGEGTGSKKDTIIALSPGFPEPCPYPLIEKDWLDRWSRSTKKFPDGLSDAERAEIEKRIIGHPQFGR